MIVNPDRRTVLGQSGAAYALGGAFSGGVIDSPTWFEPSVMGEAGPEAIMPLTRTSSGALGVRASMPYSAAAEDGAMSALVEEVQALRAELAGLRAEARATAVATNKTARILDRVTPDGSSLQTVSAS
jgi:phage-related minor tail protein